MAWWRKQQVAPAPVTTLQLVEQPDAIEIVDRAVDHWLVRYEPVEADVGNDALGTAMAASMTRQLAEAIPGLALALRDNRVFRVVFSPDARRVMSDSMNVAFSPATQQRIASGSATLVQSARGTMPVARDNAGRIVETATLVTAAGGATGGAAVTAGFAGAGLAPVVAPMLLAAGVAVAASRAEQRWLERTFGAVQGSLERIESRLRDDDAGTLAAGDRLVDLVRVDIEDGSISQQLRIELALARQNAERIYWSRREYVERFKRFLDDRYDAAERDNRPVSTWVPGIAGNLADGQAGIVDEIVVFIHAMVTRARVSAATAGVLAHEGDPRTALKMIDELHATLREDYFSLERRVHALATNSPEQAAWRRFFRESREADVAFRRIQRLEELMHRTVEDAIPARDEPLVLTLVA